ncbi:hypothetical protein HPS8415995_0119 [Glaesserella parasuis 84-15995]|nr:hypothetical protein HPS8415995_0119 [Glaesserella parasuis 84-15995]
MERPRGTFCLIIAIFFIFRLWQNGQFFLHISKRGLKALYYKALSHFLATNLSITHFLPNQTACCMDYLSNFFPSITLIRYFIYQYKR